MPALYCFARPTHEYLNLNTGEDFDRKIVVKINAVERVRAEVGRSGGRGSPSPWGPTPIPTSAARGSTG